MCPLFLLLFVLCILKYISTYLSVLRRDITEILLKVALSTITPHHIYPLLFFLYFPVFNIMLFSICWNYLMLQYLFFVFLFPFFHHLLYVGDSCIVFQYVSIRRGLVPCFVNYKKGALDSQPQVIKFTSCLPMVGGSLRVLRLLPPLKLVAMIKLKYCWKWR